MGVQESFMLSQRMALCTCALKRWTCLWRMLACYHAHAFLPGQSEMNVWQKKNVFVAGCWRA